MPFAAFLESIRHFGKLNINEIQLALPKGGTAMGLAGRIIPNDPSCRWPDSFVP